MLIICDVNYDNRNLFSSSFLVRNAGNLIPHSQHFVDELTMCEPAALELGCVVNDIKHIIVCGHSDCKAMNLLYALKDEEFASQVEFYFMSCQTYMYVRCQSIAIEKEIIFELQMNRRISPLRAWLCAHASSSLAKFQQLEITGFREPILFQAETPLRKFVVYIDPENKFAIEDKLSQVSNNRYILIH